MFVYYSSTQARGTEISEAQISFVVLDVDGTEERQGLVVWRKVGDAILM
jgi:hypothetical protein